MSDPKMEAAARRASLVTLGTVNVRGLMNEAHACLPDLRGPAATHARARIALIAGELARRGEEQNAALLRGYRRTAMAAPSLRWTRDHAGRIVPVALPEGYERSRSRRTRSRAAR
jgi:hypothetical protein